MGQRPAAEPAEPEHQQLAAGDRAVRLGELLARRLARRLQRRLGNTREAAGDVEGIMASEDAVKLRIAQMAENARRSPEAIRAQLEKEGQMSVLRSSLRREASIDFVLQNARVTLQE